MRQNRAVLEHTPVADYSNRHNITFIRCSLTAIVFGTFVILRLIADMRESVCPNVIIGVIDDAFTTDSTFLPVVIITATARRTARRRHPFAYHIRVGTEFSDLIPLELDLLEVVGALVVVLILQPVDNALTVFGIRPGKAASVIVKRILQLPGRQIRDRTLRGVISVAIPQAGSGILVEGMLIVSNYNDVIRMRNSASFKGGVIGDRDVFGTSTARHERYTTELRLQSRVDRFCRNLTRRFYNYAWLRIRISW